MGGDYHQYCQLHFDLCYSISLLCSSLSYESENRQFNSVKLTVEFGQIDEPEFGQIDGHEFGQIDELQFGQIQFDQIQFKFNSNSNSIRSNSIQSNSI